LGPSTLLCFVAPTAGTATATDPAEVSFGSCSMQQQAAAPGLAEATGAYASQQATTGTVNNATGMSEL